MFVMFGGLYDMVMLVGIPSIAIVTAILPVPPGALAMMQVEFDLEACHTEEALKTCKVEFTPPKFEPNSATASPRVSVVFGDIFEIDGGSKQSFSLS